MKRPYQVRQCAGHGLPYFNFKLYLLRKYFTQVRYIKKICEIYITSTRSGTLVPPIAHNARNLPCYTKARIPPHLPLQPYGKIRYTLVSKGYTTYAAPSSSSSHWTEHPNLIDSIYSFPFSHSHVCSYSHQVWLKSRPSLHFDIMDQLCSLPILHKAFCLKQRHQVLEWVTRWVISCGLNGLID